MKEIIDTLHNNQAASLYSVAAITALVLLCASLQAQSASKETEKLNENIPTQTSDSKFNKFDLNQDGKLSREEVASDKGLASKFDMLDLNVDGALDAKEYDTFISVVQKK
jgi:uncharacterized membrane protein